MIMPTCFFFLSICILSNMSTVCTDKALVNYIYLYIRMPLSSFNTYLTWCRLKHASKWNCKIIYYTHNVATSYKVFGTK